MVQYEPPSQDARTPPALCPKCGSHRTEVVGRSDDGKVITIRCNACGERSRIEVQQAANVDDEIDAMAHIARALATLASDESRARVLQWAAANAALDGGPVEAEDEQPVIARSSRSADDPGLSVDALHDIFVQQTENSAARHDTPSSLVRFVVGGDIRHRRRSGWLRA